jgi:hypothetical protein
MENGQLEKIVNQFVELILLMGLTLKFSFLKNCSPSVSYCFHGGEGRGGLEVGWRWYPFEGGVSMVMPKSGGNPMV